MEVEVINLVERYYDVTITLPVGIQSTKTAKQHFFTLNQITKNVVAKEEWSSSFFMIMCQNKDEPFLKGGVENTLHSNLDF